LESDKAEVRSRGGRERWYRRSRRSLVWRDERRGERWLDPPLPQRQEQGALEREKEGEEGRAPVGTPALKIGGRKDEERRDGEGPLVR
jgi:hypothetical protein